MSGTSSVLLLSRVGDDVPQRPKAIAYPACSALCLLADRVNRSRASQTTCLSLGPAWTPLDDCMDPRLLRRRPSRQLTASPNARRSHSIDRHPPVHVQFRLEIARGTSPPPPQPLQGRLAEFARVHPSKVVERGTWCIWIMTTSRYTELAFDGNRVLISSELCWSIPHDLSLDPRITYRLFFTALQPRPGQRPAKIGPVLSSRWILSRFCNTLSR